MKPITVGIVGAGQLGRMTALAGIPMGLKFEFLDSNPHSPAAGLGTMHHGELGDPEALARLANAVDIVTFEVENIPAETFQAVSDIVPMQPPAHALRTAQDRLLEKKLFQEHGIPTARFVAVGNEADLINAVAELGFPCVLKTRRLGYDGRGQMFLRSTADLQPALQALNSSELLLEQFVDFELEASLIAVRNRSGQTGFYPLTRNLHHNGILHISRAPYPDAALTTTAQQYVQRLLDHLDYCGVFTLELFVTADGLVANEIAPRVHNSGHWTIEGAVTSQFENHLRAILDWPLGSTAVTGHSAMINFLGTLPAPERCLEIPGLHYHSYEKTPRPARKIGHATIVAEQISDCEQGLEQVRQIYSSNISA